MKTANSSKSPPTILIIDDDVLSRKLLAAMLQPEGYLTQSAASGKEALVMIGESAPDLILLDLMMPDMNGYEVANILKASQTFSHIPIILVTALTDRTSRVSGLDTGAEEFLSKPIDRTELWLRVRNLLRLKEFGDFLMQRGRVLEEQVQERTSQLQAANKDLEVANEELRSFSYSIAHDLRTPLSTINGFSSLLYKEIGSSTASEKIQHYIARIQAGALLMGELIDALLSLAQLSRIVLKHERVDLSALAQTIMDGYQERQPSRVVQGDILPNMVVQGDPSLLRDVLENLLSNAWKYSRNKPETHISFSCELSPDGELTYAVKDNGAGFDMAYSDKLFGAFQRLHRESEFSGTGIGLATTHKIITSHGGRIWAKSAPGQGATFYFTIGKP